MFKDDSVFNSIDTQTTLVDNWIKANNGMVFLFKVVAYKLVYTPRLVILLFKYYCLLFMLLRKFKLTAIWLVIFNIFAIFYLLLLIAIHITILS